MDKPYKEGDAFAATLTTTGTIDGVRVYRERTFERIFLVELDFIPAGLGRPAQARIHHEVWSPALRRFDRFVTLVVQNDAIDQLTIG